jgi:hypothetical protein
VEAVPTIPDTSLDGAVRGAQYTLGMSHLSNALRAGTAAALMGSFACLGSAAASADPTTGNSPAISTLAASLSKGYSLNNCTPQNVAGSQLAVLTCGPSSDSGGPAQAKYVLFSSPDDLSGSFKASIKDDTLTACGDAGQSPTPWHQGTAGGGTRRSSGPSTPKTYWPTCAHPTATCPPSTSGGGPTADLQGLQRV